MNIVMCHGMIMTLAFILDVLWGDPEWVPHMIRLMGRAIDVFSRIIRNSFPKSERGELYGGAMLVLFMFLSFGGGSFFVLWMLYRISPVVYVAGGSLVGYQLLAMKDLKKESMQVYEQLEMPGDDALQNGRRAVSRIVGRDTEKLDEAGVVKATVETIAENTSDGEIAPLFYLALGGPVLGILYKVVNTMDSMVGYKNEKYLYYGRVAAKLDDIWNYIPARIAAYHMIIASGILGYSMKDAYLIYKRDRYCHASPNSAQTEAVMAGALGVQLAGDAYYFGKLYQKPTIGDDNRRIDREDIIHGNRILYGTSFLTLVIWMLLYGIFIIM